MTDVANVEWPEDMVVDEVTFKKGWTQARDEFGMGFIKFDNTGKIVIAEYSDSCYNNKPTDPHKYNNNIKSFTGILNMVDFAIVAIRGQLVFGFGVAMPTATNLLASNYNFHRCWDSMFDHFASLKEDEIEYFKSAVDHYVKGLNKPLTEKLTFDDLVDVNNPLYVEDVGKGFYEGKDMKAYWVGLSEEIRLFYQTGESKEDHYALESYYNDSFIKERKLNIK